jgi:hypothetical protein
MPASQATRTASWSLTRTRFALHMLRDAPEVTLNPVGGCGSLHGAAHEGAGGHAAQDEHVAQAVPQLLGYTFKLVHRI